MQWTDESGGAYGGDPYGGAAYAYAYGHEGYGHEGYVADTAKPTWDPAQRAQWTQPHPAAWDTAGGSAWDSAHGDVLTVPAPETDTQPIPFVPVPESGPAPDTPENEPVRPVFVDSTGRRQRRVRRAARLLLIPAGGYVALLISTVLGGPGISAPFVPQPDAARPATPRVTAPDSPSGVGHSAGGAGTTAHANSGPAAPRTTSAPAGRPTASTAPTATAGPTVAPTATPTPTRSSKGRALGVSHKPA